MRGVAAVATRGATTAEGWDICVAATDAPNRLLQITHDGKCNKEPDWTPNEK